MEPCSGQVRGTTSLFVKRRVISLSGDITVYWACPCLCHLGCVSCFCSFEEGCSNQVCICLFACVYKFSYGYTPRNGIIRSRYTRFKIWNSCCQIAFWHGYICLYNPQQAWEYPLSYPLRSEELKLSNFCPAHARETVLPCGIHLHFPDC